MTILFLLGLAATGGLLQDPTASAGQTQATVAQPGTIRAATRQTAMRDHGPARERRICQRELRTGTLAGYSSTCRTAAEWQALARGTQESWRQLQGTHGSTHGN